MESKCYYSTKLRKRGGSMNAKVMLSDAYTPPASNGLGWNIIGQREITSTGTYSHFVDYDSYASVMNVVTVPKGVALQYVALTSNSYYLFIYSYRGNNLFTEDNSFCMTFNRCTQYVGTTSWRWWNTVIQGLAYDTQGNIYSDSTSRLNSSVKLDEVYLSQYDTERFPAPIIQTIYGLR